MKERGDTLIEVTLALAILSLVLTSAFALANKAFLLGQGAKERSQMVAEAQQQAEALQSFRDSHRWGAFVQGSGPLPGINIRSGSGDCDGLTAGVQYCFHMVQQVVDGLNQWMPRAGSGIATQLGQAYVRIVVDGSPNDVRQAYTFEVEYGVTPRGGGQPLASEIRLYLRNLDALRQ